MRTKIKFILSLLIFFSLGGLYLYFNPSYKKSFEAKFYYSIENYEQAHKLSSEALVYNRYNKMAMTIKNQSEIAIEYKNFIKEAQAYLAKIKDLSKNDNLSKKDRIRIKLICEIVLDKFKTLSATLLTNKSLTTLAKAYRDKFQELYEKVLRMDYGD